MAVPIDIPGAARDKDTDDVNHTASSAALSSTNNTPEDSVAYLSTFDAKASSTTTPSASPSLMPRNASFSSNNSVFDDLGDAEIPPLDRLTVFDFLENLALPQRLEKLGNTYTAQKERYNRQKERIKQQSRKARERVDEWRKRVVDQPDEKLRKYRRSVTDSVNKLSQRWMSAKNVTLGEKISFIAATLNIFISGYLIGAFGEYFHYWYTLQLLWFYPIRYYKYHAKGYHYFLADLCYFVNLLLFLSIWVFPSSKRLFISTFCLGYGNNAIAIAMWRNSLVFHSLDKVTTLFIHIMPCVTLHCLVHLVPAHVQAERFPAIYAIKYSEPSSPDHYGLLSMFLWSSIPYFFWQLNYHIFITIRRREQIAGGRPTSFTWLRRSFRNTWIGKWVISLPDALQEPAFMGIQYVYALLTMVPAPLWFWFPQASAAFLLIVFTWSIHNGAVFYIDVFGNRFQKELEQMKKDVARWQTSPELMPRTPRTPFNMQDSKEAADYMSAGGSGNANGGLSAALHGSSEDLNLGAAAMEFNSTAPNTPGIDGYGYGAGGVTMGRGPGPTIEEQKETEDAARSTGVDLMDMSAAAVVTGRDRKVDFDDKVDAR